MVKIKSKNLRIPIILNLILIISSYADLALPSDELVREKFVSFNSEMHGVSQYKWFREDQNIQNTLECQSGNQYYIAQIPVNADGIKVGEHINVQKTYLFSKVKSLATTKGNLIVSILCVEWVSSVFLFAFTITILNCIYANKLLEMLLSFSSVFVYIVIAGYFFYLS